ncbi:MAG: SocA family protein [Spirochaetaceae bacterium]|nr:SocA family protein [Spirochaetaceae bacterium]
MFFSQEHYKKTKKYLFQTALYKYLAFFEFRYLKNNGDMPLGLRYIAMQHGPVPQEIYENRANPSFFSLVTFVPGTSKDGKTSYIVKPHGRFNEDYFSIAEIEEMNHLIEIFSQKWIGTGVMSDASHQEIKAWRKTFSQKPNQFIDPIEEFDRDITGVSQEELRTEELKYLMRRKMEELAE